MMSFLKFLNKYRNIKKAEGITSLSDEQLNDFKQTYNEILILWEKELEEKSKTIYEDEFKLFNRLKSEEKDEILYFLEDFSIPFTNNLAESCQRPLKIKQRIGKFRSKGGSDDYCKSKSFILTIKKRSLSIFNSICDVLNKKKVLA